MSEVPLYRAVAHTGGVVTGPAMNICAYTVLYLDVFERPLSTLTPQWRLLDVNTGVPHYASPKDPTESYTSLGCEGGHEGVGVFFWARCPCSVGTGM